MEARFIFKDCVASVVSPNVIVVIVVVAVRSRALFEVIFIVSLPHVIFVVL